MKRILRDELCEISTKYFGKKYYWKTFKENNNLTDAQVLNTFLVLEERMPDYFKYKEEVETYIAEGKKLFVNAKNGMFGIPVNRMVGNLMKYGFEYAVNFEIIFREFKKDGEDDWYLKKVETY